MLIMTSCVQTVHQKRKRYELEIKNNCSINGLRHSIDLEILVRHQ